MPGTVHAAYCYDHDAAMCPRALVSGTCHGNAPPSPFVAASVSVGILPYSMSEPASTTPSSRSVATNTAGTGGIGPVLKGQAGVNQVAADIEASGGKVLGREITVDAGGARTRPDLFVEDACGNRCFVEVKNGPTAKMTSNQKVAFPAIQSQGGVPVGANAAAAGLTPGVPIGPTPVWVVHVS